MTQELTKIEKGNSVFSTDNSYERAMQVAKGLSNSDIVPDIYRKKPENCLIALDVARQVNSSPLTVMQNLHIIKGKPSWSSSYIAGAIRSRYKKIKVILDGSGDDRGCKVVAYDESGEIIAEGVRVTIEMAKAEGWTTKTGSKWKTMPDLMLQYRANAFFGRVHCPDVLIGLQSEFEVIDVTPRGKVEIENVFAEEVPATPEVIVCDEVPEPIEEVEADVNLANVCGCGAVVTDKVRDFSVSKFGKVVCFKCQKEL